MRDSTWLITSELVNQRARKVLFTCVVYTKLSLSNSLSFCYSHLSSQIKASLDRRICKTLNGFLGLHFLFYYILKAKSVNQSQPTGSKHPNYDVTH